MLAGLCVELCKVVIDIGLIDCPAAGLLYRLAIDESENRLKVKLENAKERL